MLTVSYQIHADEMEDVGHVDYDYGFVKKFKVRDVHYSCNSPLILREVSKKIYLGGDVFCGKCYMLIERATGKCLGKTDVYDSDDWHSESVDFKEHIDDVAMNYGTFAKDLKKMKQVPIITGY